MQFEQLPGGERVQLPRPSIDTGMGLERIAAVLQGKHDNYDIDLFRALIAASAEASGVAPDGPQAVSHRVIADHLRASSFLIADGVLPSKEGRGYVLRRIMRRAMRHAQMLGCKEPLMWRLVPALVQQMGAAYPELMRAQPLITETLRLEETNFRQTLERGLGLLDDMAAGPGLTDDGRLSGTVAFTLYDTYGFPLDLTQDILRGRGHRGRYGRVRRARWKQARARSRASWVGSGEAATEATWFALRDEIGATEFLGYETENAEGVILAIMRGDERVDRGVGRRRGRRRRQPDAVLCRVRRPARRHRRDLLGAGRRAGGARHASRRPASCTCISARCGTARCRSATRSNCGSIAAGAGGCAPTIRSRICCIRRCGTGSASM